jgi:short-subunit dehydrogenase
MLVSTYFHFVMNILITGAAQGIGAAIATNLANISNTLILIDLQEDKLQEFSKSIETKCKEIKLLSGDLTDLNFINEIDTFIKNNQIDVLVNNAGIAHKLSELKDLSNNELELALKLNVQAPFYLMQSFLRNITQTGSQIINVASRANIYGYTKMGIYAASKSALTSLTGTVALENPNVKAVTIIPGRTNTPLQKMLRGEDEASKTQTPEYVGEIIAKVINGEIKTNSGDFVLIDFSEHKVSSELEKADLYNQMI